MKPSSLETRRETTDVSGRLRRLHVQAGWLGVAGGTIRLLAYSLPWIVLTARLNGAATTISGYRALGSGWLSVVYSVGVVVAAASYLAGRQEGGGRLLFSLGVASVAVFAVQCPLTLSRLEPLRNELAARDLDVAVSIGFGLWVELAGTLLTLCGGLAAYRLWTRTRARHASSDPPTPGGDLPVED
jgi:hypothetical protein